MMLISSREKCARSVDRKSKARIAILGLKLESNSFSPVTGKEEFAERFLAEGADILKHPTARKCYGPDASIGFGGTMRKLREWEPVPINLAVGGAGGPCDQQFFEWYIGSITKRLKEAGELHGVYIDAHGAGITTQLDDMDGPYFRAVRDAVGPHVPIVATLDLHGNVSDEMVEATDVQVALITNPHIDEFERAGEAAKLIDAMLDGLMPVVAFERLPLVTPQVTQLTRRGTPYGDLIAYGQTLLDETVLNISILSGFAFSDTRHNGMAILVTTAADPERAREVAHDLAARAWADRERYVPDLVSLEEAVQLAVAAGNGNTEGQIVLADVADNPGGGGRGNTVWLLEALLEAGAKGVQFGVFYDPPLVAEASALGPGAKFAAQFNRDETATFSTSFTTEAEVISIVSGKFTGTQGSAKDFEIDLGPSCLLRVGDIHIAVISVRRQMLAVEFFSHFGLDPSEASTFVVKSRGHFRASFEEIVPPDRIFEVDVPGLTTPNLASVDWRNLTSPSFPINPETVWP